MWLFGSRIAQDDLSEYVNEAIYSKKIFPALSGRNVLKEKPLVITK
jgi:hypothetical protein